MITSVAIMALALFVMSLETAEYGFGSLALTVAPIFMIISIVVGFVSIFYKEKEIKES